MNTPLVRPADDLPYGDPAVTDRALDALVAEKVMGWRSLGGRWTDTNHSGYEWIDNSGTRYLTPAFSSNIAAAWIIVEKFGREGWALHLAANRHENPPAGEECRAVFWSRGRVSQSVFASTTPVAICRAALAAAEHVPPPSRADD